MQKPKVATVWLEACSGCHMSFLDLDETLLDILKKVELTVTPITDFKDYRFPQVELGIIEGGIGNEEQLEIARHLAWPCKNHFGLGGLRGIRGHQHASQLDSKGRGSAVRLHRKHEHGRGNDSHFQRASEAARQSAPGQWGHNGGRLSSGMSPFFGGDRLRID